MRECTIHRMKVEDCVVSVFEGFTGSRLLVVSVKKMFFLNSKNTYTILY